MLFIMCNSSFRSYHRFDTQTRQKGQFCFVLTLSPRLCAFLNKGIFDSRLKPITVILPLLSLQDAEGFNAVHHVHSMVLELQAKHEKLVQTTAELVNEYNRREKSLEELYGSIDRLDQNKADKKHVSQEIGIKVSQMPPPFGRGGTVVLPYTQQFRQRSVKAYATMPIGIMGSKSLVLLEVQGDSATRNEKERIHVFVLFPSTTLKHLEP